MFDNNFLFTTLINRKDQKSKFYSGHLIQTSINPEPILNCINDELPDHPSNGFVHTERILSYVSSILSQKSIKKMSTMDIYILFLAGFFYDTGMSLYSSDYPDCWKRDMHSRLVKKVIDSYFDNHMKHFSEQERIRNAVIYICEAHNQSIEELVEDERFNYEDNIDTFEVHYGRLALLLRIGDLMNIESDRADLFRMKLYSNSLSGTSYNYNKRYFNIVRYTHKPQSIEIVVAAKNVQQYFIWSKWFAWLKQDIEKFNAIFAGEPFKLPLLKTSIVNPNEEIYSVKQIRIDADDKGQIWDIVSKSIYTYELDYLRELVQNAIDASLKKVYLDNTFTLDVKSPKAWGKFAKPIDIIHSENKKFLCVVDRGIGMDVSDLDNYLFKLSGSEIISNEDREFGFPGIAKFGIGFVSCLMNADRIVILTSKNTDVLYRATWESNSNSVIVEKVANPDRYSGTAVMLYLKDDLRNEKIEEYLKSTFRYPSVFISFHGLERLTENFESVEQEIFYRKIENKPYLISEILNEFHPIIEKIIDDLRAEQSESRKRMNYLLETQNKKIVPPNFIIDTSDIDSELNKAKLLYRSNWAKDLFGSSLEQSPIIYEEPKPKDSYSVFGLKRNIASLQKRIVQLTMNPAINADSIVDVKNGEKWDCIFWEIEQPINKSNYEMFKMDQSISLKNKTGILFIKLQTQNLKAGIECVSINCFLISNGKVVKKLHIKGNRYSPDVDIEIKIANNTLMYCTSDKSRVLKFKHLTSNIKTSEMSDFLLDVNNYCIYQDGIYIANRMIDIYPFCVSRFICNLTADARMKLNVNRHDISEISDDVKGWIRRVGQPVQEQLFRIMKERLKELDVTVDNYIDLIRLDYTEKFPDYFEHIVVSLAETVDQVNQK